MSNRSRTPAACAVFLCIVAIASAACEGHPSAAAQSGGGGGGRGGRGRGGDGGAVPVVTAAVGSKDVPVDILAIGNVEAFESVSLRSQITGTITGVYFHEGDSVKLGDKIFQIDPRPYEAMLAQAQANLTRDEALLAQAEAQLTRDAAQAEYSQLTASRSEALTDRGIIARDASQQARAASDALGATVNADKAAIASAAPSWSRSRPPWTARACNWSTWSSARDLRADRQPAGEDRRPGHGEQHRAHHHRGDRAGLRHLRRAGGAPAGNQRPDEPRAAVGHRDAASGRRRAEHGPFELRWTTPWTRPPTPSS